MHFCLELKIGNTCDLAKVISEIGCINIEEIFYLKAVRGMGEILAKIIIG